MENYRPNLIHDLEEVDVVTKWLKAFKDGQIPHNRDLGLCTAVIEECDSILVQQHSYGVFELYPINDTESGLSPAYQYECLPHYKGRQLELRVEYAEYLIDYFNESIRI